MFYFIIIWLCDHVLSAELAKQRSSYFLTSDIPWQTQIWKLYKTKLRLPTIIESGLDRALIKSKTMKTDSRFQEGLTKNVQWSLNHQEDRTQKRYITVWIPEKSIFDRKYLIAGFDSV